MTAALPAQARVAIIGGGIVGCAVAYHLTRLGWRDVILLEQGRLSGGTTWHAAGLVGQLRSHANMTRLIRASTELYAGLEAETGQATGWKRCGSVVVARTQERMTALRRMAAMAKGQGVECVLLSPAECARRWPLLRHHDLEGGAWLPGDGKANPADITQALAKGARARGARFFESTRVTGIEAERGAVARVITAEGVVAVEIAVNCAGQWARQVGALAGVTVPMHSAEHMYIVTRPIDGVVADLPVLRDPDGYVYFKEEVGGLAMGGFEPDAKPWGMDGIPADFEFRLLPDDWDQFEILMQNALIRVPALERAEIRQFINGPESFTPDNNFILGEAPGLRNFFIAAGFNSMGIAAAGGAGEALAQWIVGGEPPFDLWPVDVRRFARFHGNQAWLRDRVKETLGLHYAMPWPNRELSTARPLRRSPLHERLAQLGAVFGSKMGWERVNWFAPPGSPREPGYAWGRQAWFDAAAREHGAAREAVALFDLTSFAKFLLQGRDAEAALQRLCCNDVAVPPGRMVYTGMLNARGGYESDLTVTRLDAQRYLLVTGSAQATRDRDWIERHLGESRAALTDITSAYAVLAVVGPRSRALLQGLGRDDLGNDAFAHGTLREIGIGHAQVLAGRISYAGELGWELYVPTEMAVHVHERLIEAGEGLGLVHAGYYALESLRLEKAYRAWGRELNPDVSPWEAGLGFTVRLGKDFIGRDALLAAKAQPTGRRIAAFTLDDPAPVAWGGELVVRQGRPAGEVTSAAYGHTLGRTVLLALVHDDGPGPWHVDIAGATHAATTHRRAPWDPEGKRLKA